MNEELNNLIEAFVALPTEVKPDKIIDEIKEQIVLYQSLCKQYGFNSEIVLNKEMVDILKDDKTIDDYYEAIYAYLKSLEDISGKFLNEYLKNYK